MQCRGSNDEGAFSAHTQWAPRKDLGLLSMQGQDTMQCCASKDDNAFSACAQWVPRKDEGTFAVGRGNRKKHNNQNDGFFNKGAFSAWAQSLGAKKR
jgi:hypothetical protein